MLPPALRVDLRPRRSRLGLRLLAIAALAVAGAAAALCLTARQSELDRLALSATQVREAAARLAPPAASASRPAPWQAGAEQNAALFALPADPRLLEIEHCTDAKTVVTRIVHDASASSTSLELDVFEPKAVRSLLECLNQPDTGQPVWRLLSVENQAAAGGAGSDHRRVVLRYR
jgi:hypothetical protein